MNREDVIRWATKCNLGLQDRVVHGEAHFSRLHEFAALAYAAGAEAEREKCAKIAETPVSGEQDDITMEAKDRVAAAIRARGNGGE